MADSRTTGSRGETFDHGARGFTPGDPRWIAVALLDRPSRIPPPGGLAPASGPVAWITDNLLKGISSKPAVTLHATPGFSREDWDRERLETGRPLLSSVAEWLGSGIRTFQIHGWRYSQPRLLDRDPCLLINACPPLVLAGDAFGQGIVEGAAHFGWAAAGTILAHRPHAWESASRIPILANVIQ